jgi:hypothetical protein
MTASSLDLAPLEEGLRPGAFSARARSLSGGALAQSSDRSAPRALPSFLGPRLT